VAERRDPGRATLTRLELEVRRDHPMTHEELTAVRAAVRAGQAAPDPLRRPAHALAAATLRSSDRGVAPSWLLYGLLVLALVNAGRAVREPGAPWAVPMAVLYAVLAAGAWVARRVREQRARAALAANAPAGFPGGPPPAPDPAPDPDPAPAPDPAPDPAPAPAPAPDPLPGPPLHPPPDRQPDPNG
jgi:hypothetical protein